MVDKYFCAEELEPVIKDLEWLVDQAAQTMYRAGKIKGENQKSVKLTTIYGST